MTAMKALIEAAEELIFYREAPCFREFTDHLWNRLEAALASAKTSSDGSEIQRREKGKLKGEIAMATTLNTTNMHLEKDPDMIWGMLDVDDKIRLRFDCGDAGMIVLTQEQARNLRKQLRIFTEGDLEYKLRDSMRALEMVCTFVNSETGEHADSDEYIEMARKERLEAQP